MVFRPFSYFCVCARLFPAVYLPKQKLKIWPFRAIIESILSFNLLTYLLSHMIACKNPSYFSQLFYAPLCLNTLLSFLASFLPWLIPFRPLGFVAPQQHWQIPVWQRSPYREKVEGHCGEEAAFLERWNWNTSMWASSGFEHRSYYKSYRIGEDRSWGRQSQPLCKLVGDWTARSFSTPGQTNMGSTAPSLFLLGKFMPSYHSLLLFLYFSFHEIDFFFSISAPWKLNSLPPNTLLVQSLYRHIRSEWNYTDARHKTCIKNFPF